jgi:hypothetical protein
MQISIKKTSANYETSDSIIEELEKRIGQFESDYPLKKALSLLNEAADLLESEDKYSDLYDGIINVIDMFSKDHDEDVVEINSPEEVEEDVQEEVEKQKE